MRTPEFSEAVDEEGEFPVDIRLDDGIQRCVLAHHPFDAVGWDGLYYPWIFHTRNFMPKAGKVHLPPPGLLEESLGARETREYAVMIDTFRPLVATEASREIDDESYPLSWLEEE